jgi:peptide/nickel transport system substrate-binding protein
MYSWTKPRTSRAGAVGAAVASLSLTMSACSVANSDSASTTVGGDVVRIVLPQEPPTLEPCDANLTSTGVVVRSNITEPLVERDPTSGQLEPLLATEWEQTEPDTWTFTLQDGVTFSDGTPFDAEAAAHSIDRAVNGTFGCNVEGYVFGDTDLEVDPVDATHLTVTTPEPDPILPLRLSFIEIVPASASDTEKVREPVGTGPYRIKQWQTGTRLTLEANESYWGEAPAFGTAEYQWREEGAVRAAMITNGEADVATGLAPEDGLGDAGVSYPNNETTAVRATGTYAPLDDIRVRHAINYAIDRGTIVDSLFEGYAEVASQLVPEGVVGHNPDLEPWPFDPEKARSLIAEAKADGVPTGTEIRLISRTGLFPKVEDTVQVVQKELEDVGLNVSIELLDTAASIQYQSRPFPEDTGPYLMLVQHGNQAGDAAFSVDQYMLSNGAQSTFGTDEFDAQIKAAGKEEGEGRQEAYADTFADEPEAIGQFAYIAHMTGVIGLSDQVSYTPNSATGDEMRLAEMTAAG